MGRRCRLRRHLALSDPLALSGVGREPPPPSHLMGTDLLGRDILSRVMFGARISLAIGLISVAIGVVSGSVIGVPRGTTAAASTGC